MNRAQCIVHHGNKLLMVKHRLGGMEWWCLPGGGVESNETAAQAALRELEEECHVGGKIIRQLAAYTDDSGVDIVTFLVDIGDQQPHLGDDPELANSTQILSDMRWLPLAEICERDRAYLWAAGLLCLPPFLEEVSRWGDDLSFPAEKTHV